MPSTFVSSFNSPKKALFNITRQKHVHLLDQIAYILSMAMCNMSIANYYGIRCGKSIQGTAIYYSRGDSAIGGSGDGQLHGLEKKESNL